MRHALVLFLCFLLASPTVYASDMSSLADLNKRTANLLPKTWEIGRNPVIPGGTNNCRFLAKDARFAKAVESLRTLTAEEKLELLQKLDADQCQDVPKEKLGPWVIHPEIGQGNGLAPIENRTGKKEDVFQVVLSSGQIIYIYKKCGNPAPTNLNKGEKGEYGLQGQRGLDGPMGPQGLRGPQGERGSQGIQGPQGEKGPGCGRGCKLGIFGAAVATAIVASFFFSKGKAKTIDPYKPPGGGGGVN